MAKVDHSYLFLIPFTCVIQLM